MIQGPLCVPSFSATSHTRVASMCSCLPGALGMLLLDLGTSQLMGPAFPSRRETLEPCLTPAPPQMVKWVLSNWADSPECPRVRWGDDSARLVLEQRGRLEGGCRMLRKWLLFRRVPDGWEAVRSDRFAQLHLMMPKETSVPCLGTFQQTTVQPPNWGLMLCWILKAT